MQSRHQHKQSFVVVRLFKRIARSFVLQLQLGWGVYYSSCQVLLLSSCYYFLSFSFAFVLYLPCPKDNLFCMSYNLSTRRWIFLLLLVNYLRILFIPSLPLFVNVILRWIIKNIMRIFSKLHFYSRCDKDKRFVVIRLSTRGLLELTSFF